MEYNRFIDLSKSYLYCHLQRSKDPLKSRQSGENHFPFLTISREAGTGESMITASLLEELTKHSEGEDSSWALYDKDLVRKVAEDYDISGIDGLLPEAKFSDIQTMFEELFGLHPTKREMAHNISKSIIKLAQMGNAVIVGRGGFYITRHFRNGLHVRLIGSQQNRIRHMVEKYDMTLKQAGEYIRKEDQRRYEYVKKLFGIDLNDPHFYDLVINTDRLNSREIVALIADNIELLKEKLALSYNSRELTAV
jgi:cytidylate kinase